MPTISRLLLAGSLCVAFVLQSGPAPYVAGGAEPVSLDQSLNTWLKRSPLATTPPSPRLGYEGACVWDGRHKLVIRYGGHNQGGGGEQGSEMWTFEPLSARWELKDTNHSPPGVCCDAQNVFDPAAGRYVRFPSFSGSHGWQWFREIYLNDTSAWNYDVDTNTWRNMRPLPTPRVHPLRCATWDSEHQAIVLFGGEGSSEGTLAYDPHTNTWTRMNPAVQPEFRSGGNMAYDEANRVHVLFGAQFINDPYTWVYDLRKNEWQRRTPDVMPPTDKNDAVLTYDPFARRVLAIIKVSEGEEERQTHRLETWSYDTAKNLWTKLNPPQEPDPTGNRARQLMFAPELNATILENRTHGKSGTSNEQQIWTYRLAERPGAELLPPHDVVVATSSEAVTLRWKPSSGNGVAGYVIERGTGAVPWRVEFQPVATVDPKTTEYREDAGKGEIRHYRLRARAADGMTGPASVTVRTQPRVAEDTVASVVSAQRVELSWKAPPGEDAAGYLVERAPVEVLTEDQLHRLKTQTPPLGEPSVGAIRRVGRFTRLTAEPFRQLKFADTQVDLSKSAVIEGEPVYERKFDKEQFDESGRGYRFGVFAYRIVAVNALGVESGPSPAILTLPSPPQFVFAKEEGTTCRLRWTANPESNLRGYRVYRMDGRYNKDPIRRLTEEPISNPDFIDPEAGKPTRRFYIVAVDAIGQEGFPSSPVWFNREWRDFYRPFEGEWHQ